MYPGREKVTGLQYGPHKAALSAGLGGVSEVHGRLCTTRARAKRPCFCFHALPRRRLINLRSFVVVYVVIDRRIVGIDSCNMCDKGDWQSSSVADGVVTNVHTRQLYEVSDTYRVPVPSTTLQQYEYEVTTSTAVQLTRTTDEQRS